MNLNKYQKLCKLLSEHNFEVAEEISDEVLCVLCRKLMIEPYSTECGCAFCKKCITDYLNNAKKLCPGSKEDCKSNTLEIEVNVSKDMKVRRCIGQTKVKCPNGGCLFTIELNAIEDHILNCRMALMSCPFQAIGCFDTDTTGDSINNHLQQEALAHSHLLLDEINHLRNDLNQQREGNESKDEVRKLKEDCENNKNELAEQRRLTSELKEENVRNKRDIENQRQEIRQLKEGVDRSKRDGDMISKDVIEVKTDVKMLKNKEWEVKELQEVMEALLKQELDKMKHELEALKKEVGGKQALEDIRKLVEKQSQEVNNVRNKVTKCAEDIDKMSTIKSELMLNMTYDCVWRINDLLKKKGEHFSDVFSVNNYKLCLRAWLGTDNLWLFVCVKRGDSDNKAEWPIQHTITLSVMNQDTLRPCVSERYSVGTYDGDGSVFNKPSNDTDGRIGNLQLSLADIKRLRGLLSRDSLMVGCSLQPPSR